MAKCRNCKTNYEGLGYICPDCGFDNETAVKRKLPGCISTAIGCFVPVLFIASLFVVVTVLLLFRTYM